MSATAAATTALERETSRLRDLQQVNRSVRESEIALTMTLQHDLDQALKSARLRLDAVRLIYRGPGR